MTDIQTTWTDEHGETWVPFSDYMHLKAQLEKQTYTYIGKDGRPVLARDLEDRLEEALTLTKAERNKPRVDEWQPIGTAPKDGKDILVGWHSDHYERFIWTRAGQVKGIWYHSGGTGVVCYPTHWMPLPEPPAALEGQDQ